MKTKKNKLVPKLRFPEFKDDGEWQEDSLGGNNIALFVNEKMPFHELRLETYVSTENLLSNYEGKSIASKLPATGSVTRFKKEDILLSNIRPYLKKVWFANMDGGASNDVIVIRADSKIEASFLSFMLINDAFITYIMKGAEGVKMPRGDKDLIKEYPLIFPEKSEQQKIASCLSSLDEYLTAQSNKLEALKAHKKGLMQQLFPAEGETVPKLRFAEVRDNGEWKKKTIDEIAQVTSGGTPDSTNEKFWNGDIPWINSGELNNKRIYSVSNGITSLGLEESSTKLIPPRCVLIGLAGQGKTRGTAAINYIELCTNQSIASIHPNNYVFNSEFLYQRINSMYDQLRALSTGEGGRGGLNLQIIKSIEVRLPSLDEQQNIADCLSSLDELITAQAEKIEALKTHKKGLMQGLFPSTN